MEPVFFMPRDIMIDIGQNPKRKAVYQSLIEEVAYIFVNDRGAYVEKATIARDALDIVDFEIELAKVSQNYHLSILALFVTYVMTNVHYHPTSFYFLPFS